MVTPARRSTRIKIQEVSMDKKRETKPVKKSPAKKTQTSKAAPPKPRPSKKAAAEAKAALKARNRPKKKAKATASTGVGAKANPQIYEGPPKVKFPIDGKKWPAGWVERRFKRQSGASKGSQDIYFYPPGTDYKLRSTKEVLLYLEAWNTNKSILAATQVIKDSRKTSSKKGDGKKKTKKRARSDEEEEAAPVEGEDAKDTDAAAAGEPETETQAPSAEAKAENTEDAPTSSETAQAPTMEDVMATEEDKEEQKVAEGDDSAPPESTDPAPAVDAPAADPPVAETHEQQV